MDEKDLKALAHALIAECSADTLTALQNALKTAQADESGATLNELLIVSRVAVEISADRAAQEAQQAVEPQTIAQALEQRKAARK